MKVLINCLNSKFIHASLAPWCLYSGVKNFCKNQVDVKVIESTINNDISYHIDKIIKENPDIVSFSTYIWNVEKTFEICKEVKKQLNCTILVGGPEVSYRAKNVLSENEFIDYVLCGEGEETFPEFIDKFHSNNHFDVAGLCYRHNGEIIENPEKEYTGTPPTPYCDEFYDNLKGRISYIESSRGCPFRCAFCLSGRCSKLRFFDMELVKKEILDLSVSGTQTIKFVDRTFNANAERANEIYSFIIENYGKKIPQGVCFHFEIAGDILKESTMKILESAPKGAIQLEIGMQTFNEDTLRAINRTTNTEKLINNIKRLISFENMHIHIDLIAGLVNEDMKSFERSFNIGYGLKADMLQMGFLKLLYGAEMRENPQKFPCTFTENPPYEVTETPWLSRHDVKSLKKCEDALERLYNSGRFILTLDYLIDECNFEPFKLFMEFGKAVDGTNMRLSEYAEKLYNFFKNRVEKDLLREKIVCDLLSCASGVQLPDCLKVKDKRYKQIKKLFQENSHHKYQIAILYKTEQVFVVNQSTPKDKKGRYKGEYYNFSEFDFFE